MINVSLSKEKNLFIINKIKHITKHDVEFIQNILNDTNLNIKFLYKRE